MAARIVGNQRDRWATIAIAPLLTCGARLPVYALSNGFADLGKFYYRIA